jgi:hypothetical protein
LFLFVVATLCGAGADFWAMLGPNKQLTNIRNFLVGGFQTNNAPGNFLEFLICSESLSLSGWEQVRFLTDLSIDAFGKKAECDDHLGATGSHQAAR